MRNTASDLLHANGVLSESQVHKLAPSVFATDRNHNSTSDRYSFLSTAEILKPLQAEGWNIVGASQTKARRVIYQDADGNDVVSSAPSFARHMLVLAHSRDLENYSYHKVCPRVVLINSHDGSSACKLSAGLFRLACANGLIVADSTVQSRVIRHSRTTIEQCILAAIYLRDQSENILNRVEAFSARELDRSEQIGLASRALEIRFDGEEAGARPTEILRARRIEDRGNDLWRTFNRVQENIIRGGFEVVRPKLGWQVGEQRAKEIKAIDALVGINTQLWAAAEDLVLPA